MATLLAFCRLYFAVTPEWCIAGLHLTTHATSHTALESKGERLLTNASSVSVKTCPHNACAYSQFPMGCSNPDSKHETKGTIEQDPVVDVKRYSSHLKRPIIKCVKSGITHQNTVTGAKSPGQYKSPDRIMNSPNANPFPIFITKLQQMKR